MCPHKKLHSERKNSKILWCEIYVLQTVVWGRGDCNGPRMRACAEHRLSSGRIGAAAMRALNLPAHLSARVWSAVLWFLQAARLTHFCFRRVSQGSIGGDANGARAAASAGCCEYASGAGGCPLSRPRTAVGLPAGAAGTLGPRLLDTTGWCRVIFRVTIIAFTIS